MQIDSEYLSHQPVLIAAMDGVKDGRVLELGAGFGSTPILHALCAATGCELVTLDSSPEWLARFEYLRKPWHRLDAAGDFLDIPEYAEGWDVAVVDHAQEKARGVSVLRLVDAAEVLIAHDSCHGFLYGYDSAFLSWAHRLDYIAARPFTTALSSVPGRLDRMMRILG